jgi:AcrR family transcriptional regulator
MARPRNDDVRRAAIEATIDCIAANGVVGLSMREVARTTGVSTGTLSHHFGSKRSLLLEAITFGYWQLPEWFGKRPAVDSMRYVLARYELSTPKLRAWWRFWLAISAHGQVDDGIRTLMLDEYRSVEDRWTNALGRGQREDGFDTGFDPREAAVHLAALAHGIALAQLVGAMPVEVAAGELRAALDALGARSACPTEGA